MSGPSGVSVAQTHRTVPGWPSPSLGLAHELRPPSTYGRLRGLPHSSPCGVWYIRCPTLGVRSSFAIIKTLLSPTRTRVASCQRLQAPTFIPPACLRTSTRILPHSLEWPGRTILEGFNNSSFYSEQSICMINMHHGQAFTHFCRGACVFGAAPPPTHTKSGSCLSRHPASRRPSENTGASSWASSPSGRPRPSYSMMWPSWICPG